ncbi:Insulin-degrading enzyme, partial [Trachymyrmex cornetzi]
GSMCDPDDLPGLAHLCEHMLFLGTKKYPQQNDDKIFLAQNGGWSNATTSSDYTIYNFYVIPEKLEGALDRFAQFFLAPLFTENLMELELKSINSEFENNLTADSRRCWQLQKSSASSDHPFSKFSTGNRETLSTIPKQKGINVRNKLLEFHEKYYSANIMSLSVLGKESLDELENMVVNLFCEIRNKEIEVPMVSEHPFKDEHFGTVWYIVPIKNIRNLTISFLLPDLRQHYRSKPERYVSHLLEHEGEGSLLSSLRAKGWCISLTCGLSYSVRSFSIFNIETDLTEEGIKHIEDIVLMVFQYINMLNSKGPIKWIYEEYRDIDNMDFRFKGKSSAENHVKFTARALQNYPMNEILCPHIDWRPDVIEEIMKYLKPQNVRIYILAKEYENITNEIECWYGTKYRKVKVSKETMDMWNSPGFNDELKLPPKNEFIPTTFDLKVQQTNLIKNIFRFPFILEDTSFVRLWYKQYGAFSVPTARMNFYFSSPFVFMDPLSYNSTYLFVKLFHDSLNEDIYAADLAGLESKLDIFNSGITLSLNGYNDKQRVMLEKIMDRMINFKVDPKMFEIRKEEYIRSLKDFAAEEPYEQAVSYLTALLAKQHWLNEELLEATTYLNVEGFQRFIQQLFSKVHVECLINGNVTKTEATDILKLIESKLTTGVPNIVPLLEQQLVMPREIKLENGCHFLFEAENNFHKNSCTVVYYPTGLQSTESNMLLELLVQIIKGPCYDTFRTKEQLGYSAFSDRRESNATQGLRISVISDKHPQYVEKRINLFLDSMLASIIISYIVKNIVYYFLEFTYILVNRL